MAEEVPFAIIEEVPTFPGCKKLAKSERRKCFQERMDRHVLRKFRYPEIAQEMGITEDELVKWETAFQANTPQSLDAVYDQFSMWFFSDQSTPE